jgi:glycosyltransferase involved in cell wall biosynthesis
MAIDTRRQALSDLLAVIPALNEEATVASVVRGVIDEFGCDVLVVDDGSTDDTGRAARNAGAYVLTHPFNLGVGAALRSGFRYAKARGYDTVVQLDADGQHDAAGAAQLIDSLDRLDVDVVVGSRFAAGYRIGRTRRLAMRWLARVVRRRLGVDITDATSGFRAFGPRAVNRFASAYPTAYLSDTVEALLLAGDWGLAVVEVPVQMHERQGGTPSARSVRSAFHLLRLVLVIRLHRVRHPLRERRSG